MPLSIRNKDTVALAREVAALTGRSVTKTIHDALEREKAVLPRKSELDAETAAFLAELHAQVRADSTCSRIVDKAFYDSLYED